MKRHLPHLSVAFLAMLFCGSLPLMAQEGYETTIPFTETFDDESHFSLGGDLPDGWASYSAFGDYYGFNRYDYTTDAPHSGDYFIGCYGMSGGQQDVIFTPMLEMESGQEYTISIFLRYTATMPGRTPSYTITAGSGQAVENQTITIAPATTITNTEWAEISATFTPETSGTYSVALQITSGISTSSFVYVDDFTIDGKAVTPPDPEEPYVTTIPFTEAFDDDSHYVNGGTLPDSWATEGSLPFATIEGSTQSITPHSGNRILFSENSTSTGRQDWLYTPMLDMEAYTTYNISFYLMLDGGSNSMGQYSITAGTAQNAAAQTTVIAEGDNINYPTWTLVEASFTPTESGQYSIAFCANSTMSNCGNYAIDDFSIEVGGTVDPPAEEWEPSIPYAENFDDATHYDGNSYLPKGWFSSGDNPFFTANSNSIPAVSGEYYMITTGSVIDNRRDIAYSPLLDMEAGVEYKVSFYLCCPGGNTSPSFKFTWGNEQAYDIQETLLEINNERVSDWTRYEYTVTPTADGQYCFAFWACSEEASDGYICIDNFRLRRADDIFAPEAGFEFGNTLHSVFTSDRIIFPGQAVALINTTDDADSYTWSVEGGNATISDTNAVNPTIMFSEAGSYTVTLKAENGGGESEVSSNIRVSFPTKGETDALQTTSDTQDEIFEQYYIPAFREDGTIEEGLTYETYFNYVVGVNQYYRAFAERFDIPNGCEMTLTSISFISQNYFLFDQTLGIYDDEGNFIGNSSFDKDKKLSIAIYPEKDGRPDVENAIYRKTDLISNIIHDDYHAVRIGVNFDDAEEEVKVDGPFYVALEFDQLTLEPYSQDILSRSYVGLDTRVHANGETTLWVKPDAAIPGSSFEQTGTLGEYCRADEFSRQLSGYSFCVMPWVVYGEMPEVSGIEEVGDNAVIKIYASIDGENYKIAGLQDGDNVRVYSIGGTLMYAADADNSEMIVETSGWSRGVYVISVNGNQAIKVIK